MERLSLTWSLVRINIYAVLCDFSTVFAKKNRGDNEKKYGNLQKYFTSYDFQADKLKAYRFCDNVWTFVMENVEFRDVTQPVDGVVDRVKIVACDASAAKLVNT